MLTKSLILSSLSMLALICLTLTVPVFAQGVAPTNWETHQQGAINQDMAAGALNPNQAAALQNREAQIQAQQQQYMNQNGGTLAPQQQRQIDNELRGVNKSMNRDVRYDASRGNPYAAQAFGQQMQNGYPVQGQWPHPQWQNGMQGQGQWPNQQWQNQQNLTPQQWQALQNSNPQQMQNGMHHHHHHDGFGGNGFNPNGVNGNGFNPNGLGANGAVPGFGGGFGGGGGGWGNH